MKPLQRNGFAVAWVLCLLGAACGQPPAGQQAPGTIPSSTFPQSPTPVAAGGNPPQLSPLPSRAQNNAAYRWAYAMDTANKAAQLGAILGGPFGGPASMGMGLLGLLYGAATAESQLAEENVKAQTQYQKESSKDQQLEAAIEQEIERQRAFESQITRTTGGAQSEQAASLSQTPHRVSAPAPDAGGIITASLNKPGALPIAPTPFRNVQIKDLNGDGIADLWIYYSPQNADEVLRQEESSKLDGRVDTWSYFKDGKLVRRDVDNHGHGRPDTVYYYDDQLIVREERDEAGQGRITYRADYEDGRLAKVERQTRDSGRTDLWIIYDITIPGEIILKEERDLDGDGFPDLWSHYDGGRLVRRDLNASGLELFSKQDETPLRGTPAIRALGPQAE